MDVLSNRLDCLYFVFDGVYNINKCVLIIGVYTRRSINDEFTSVSFSNVSVDSTLNQHYIRITLLYTDSGSTSFAPP